MSAIDAGLPALSGGQLLELLLLVQAGLLGLVLVAREALRPLGLFFLALALHMLANLISVQSALRLPDLRPALSLSYGPLLYAQVRRFAWQARPSLAWRHGLPALLGAIILALHPAWRSGFWLPVLLSLTTYLALAFRELASYHRALRATRSDYGRLNLEWLRNSLAALLAIGLFDLARQALRPYAPELSHTLGLPAMAALLAFVCYLLWHGLRQPGIFQGLPEAERALAEASSGSTTSATPDPEQQVLAEILARHMDQARPYLDPGLSLAQLAEQLDWPARQLSAVINRVHARGFNDFINAYRIAEAQRLLADPARSGDKLIAIQLDSGFNSKSVFNAQFKQLTGQTPSAYRAAVRSDARPKNRPDDRISDPTSRPDS